jgi:hypothetical protein
MNFFPNPNNLFPLGEIAEFVDYCISFYDEKEGLEPIASKKQIRDAVYKYIMTTENEIVFDSLDREGVRMILQPEYRIF